VISDIEKFEFVMSGPWLAANIALRECSEDAPAELLSLQSGAEYGTGTLVVVMLGLVAACTSSSLAVRGLADQGDE
jgi:hypothetical protein